MALIDTKYKRNQSIVKVLGHGNHKKIKVVRCNYLRTKGIEEEGNYKRSRTIENDKKLGCNIRRAKNKIYELAFCNPWDYFFTATLDKTKYDRENLEKFHKDITRWFLNYNRLHDCDIKFLLIPELHKDGKSWHMHGFLANVPYDDLTQFKIGDIMGGGIAKKVKKGDVVYNWKAYQKKFGFCDLEPIRSHEAVSKYITKYIDKNLASSVKEVGAHLYYHSRGLKTAETVQKGYWNESLMFEPSYEGDYVTIYEFDYSDELLNVICNGFTPDDGIEEYWSIEHYNNYCPFVSIPDDVGIPF